VGAPARSQACHSSDRGRAAGFVAELGPTRLLASKARERLSSLGSAGRAARTSVADVGLASGAARAGGASRRSARSNMGIAWRDSGGPGVDVGRARASLPARRARALMGGAAAAIGPASRAVTSSASGATTACARSLLGRAGRASSFVGRTGAGSGTGRARQTRLSDGAFMEPADTGLGSAQARGIGAAGTLFGQLGSTTAGGSRAAAHRRAFVGSSGRTSRAEVRLMERTGCSRLGHAEDRRAGCPGGPFMGSAGRGSGGQGGGSAVEPARSANSDIAMVDPGGTARTGGARPDRRGAGRGSRVGCPGGGSAVIESALGSSQVQRVAGQRGGDDGRLAGHGGRRDESRFSRRA
jgi:hypothetical protein